MSQACHLNLDSRHYTAGVEDAQEVLVALAELVPPVAKGAPPPPPPPPLNECPLHRAPEDGREGAPVEVGDRVPFACAKGLGPRAPARLGGLFPAEVVAGKPANVEVRVWNEVKDELRRRRV